MDIRKLQRAIVDGLEDVKAQNIVVFNTEHLSPLFERVIIASGTSNRQTKSLASSVRDAVKTSGFPVLRTEGETNGEWIIVDCGAAVVHVMQPSIREYYHLEEIWGDKPVNMKLASVAVRLVKAAEPEKAAPAKAGARKSPAKRAPAARPPAQRAQPARPPAQRGQASKPSARPAAKKAPAGQVTAKKIATTRTPTTAKLPARKTTAPVGKAVVTRVVGVKRPAAKVPAAKKTPSAKTSGVVTRVAAKKAPARTAAAPKPAVKRPIARKSPSRA